MGCCGNKRTKPADRKVPNFDVMGGYGYLQAHQIRARLEVFKRKNCGDCEKRYDCDYNMYQQCQKFRIN